MSFAADTDELSPALNELLEAERAGGTSAVSNRHTLGDRERNIDLVAARLPRYASRPVGAAGSPS